MQYVYFGQELAARAPHLFGQLTQSPAVKWVTMADVAEAIERGEPVHVRPASEAEINRANKVIALHEIVCLLGHAINDVLDAHDVEQPDIETTITRVRAALEEIDTPQQKVLDQEGCHGPA